MPDDRRAYRSLKRVTVRFGMEKPQYTGFTKNLSTTGIFIKTPKVFKAGTVLQLNLRVKDLSIDMQGRVVWAKVAPPKLALVLESGMGLHFIDPSNEWVEFCHSLKKPG